MISRGNQRATKKNWSAKLRETGRTKQAGVKLGSHEVEQLRNKLRAAAYGPSGKNLKRLFNLFDVNGDGTLSPSELGTVVQRMLPGSMSRQTLDKMMEMVDASGDGHISFEEFSAFIEGRELPRQPPQPIVHLSAAELDALKLQLRRKLRVAAVRFRNKLGAYSWKGTGLRAVFQQYDVNGDQQLSLSEFTHALDEMVSISTAQARALFKAVDADGSGYVDYDEFLKFSRG